MIKIYFSLSISSLRGTLKCSAFRVFNDTASAAESVSPFSSAEWQTDVQKVLVSVSLRMLDVHSILRLRSVLWLRLRIFPVYRLMGIFWISQKRAPLVVEASWRRWPGRLFWLFSGQNVCPIQGEFFFFHFCVVLCCVFHLHHNLINTWSSSHGKKNQGREEIEAMKFATITSTAAVTTVNCRKLWKSCKNRNSMNIYCDYDVNMHQ